MKSQFNRRQFLKRSSLSAAGFWIAQSSWAGISPNEKLNIGVIGTGNRAGADLDGVSSENIVALCDIDENFLAKAKLKHARAATYFDFRKMLERNDLDAVVVGTPDHFHAVATVAALKSGRHVYCEKPLTHTVSEARIVAETAKKYKRITQMGNQIHATSHYRRVIELVQSGAIGTIKEAHCWAEYPWETKPLPSGEPVPKHVHWDLWLGPVAERPYSSEYHPFNWRRWWHFGGGTLGDFCCHLMDLPFWALNLEHPQTIEAEGPPVDAECAPQWLIVNYQYAGTKKSPAVKVVWYSGGKRPSIKLPEWKGNGVLFVGSKGMLLTDYGKMMLLPAKDFAGFVAPKPFIPESIGHHQEWIHAIKTGGKTTCNFGYGALLTEAGLLGNVAYRTGKKLEWDAAAMKAKNCPEAEEYIQHHYRSGWTL